MFVGETGIGRVVKRTLEVMKELGTDNPEAIRRHGAVDLPLLQRYLNFWFSSSLDLFGSEISSNAANSFANGIKGRPDESQYEDHAAREGTYEVALPDGDHVKKENVAMRSAMNEITRAAYVKDCEIGLKRWNMQIKRAGHGTELTLPSTRFRRNIGTWANVPADPQGGILSREDYDRRIGDWLPNEADRAHVKSLMQRVVEPGKMAGWIAAPDRGINNMPADYEYVKLN